MSRINSLIETLRGLQESSDDLIEGTAKPRAYIEFAISKYIDTPKGHAVLTDYLGKALKGIIDPKDAKVTGFNLKAGTIEIEVKIALKDVDGVSRKELVKAGRELELAIEKSTGFDVIARDFNKGMGAYSIFIEY